MTQRSPLSVVIHGHFYQPPRDDPWLETVEEQPSASPYHDWNERVAKECYRAVVAARVLGSGGRIQRIANLLERISFDFGPTLLEWLEREDRPTYRAVLAADAASARSALGHGNAIAQAYHHTILPLASRREKVTEVRWGVEDFRRRFGREPLGMWLPETAVDSETLDVLASEGIQFTILAPHQVKKPPPNGLPGMVRTSRGRSIAVFVYDGPLSHGVAFGSLLQDADSWATSMVEDPPEPSTERTEHRIRRTAPAGQDSLVSVATDGETYGHHHRFGEMALAAVLEHLDGRAQVRVENFSSFLFRNPPRHEVDLVEPSSWSCSHGVERWRADCGCKMDPSAETQQEWRKGLRAAVEWLANRIHEVFEAEGAGLLGDPWASRDQYGPWARIDTDALRARELLELERQALRLFTSCGWFFDDLAGIEARQILRYAARALELLGPERSEAENGFLQRLALAISNETPPRTGRTIFLQDAVPAVPAHLRVAAGAALLEATLSPRGSSTGDGPGGEQAEVRRPDPVPTAGPSLDLPGYRVGRVAPSRFHVVHRRTGREWAVETRILRPSDGQGGVAARLVGDEEAFVPLNLSDLPEAYRDAIEVSLSREFPDLEDALLAAVEALDPGSTGDLEQVRDGVRRVLDLTDLVLLLEGPVPFDVQTRFFQIMQSAPPETAHEMAVLRKPLGFTSDS